MLRSTFLRTAIVAFLCTSFDTAAADSGLVFTSTVDYEVPTNVSVPIASPPQKGLPLNYGLVLFQGFEPLDVFGPIDVLYSLSRSYPMQLSIIAKTLDPLSNGPIKPMQNMFNSSFFPRLLPTHTFAAPPQDLDVLLVPGGSGTRAADADLADVYNFINGTYPKVKYLITVCTGAMLAAKAGVLDGRNATTNKLAWKTVIQSRPQVNWVPHARWVNDGNIWSGSGVSAGIDTTAAFVASTFGMAVARNITNQMEYKWDPDSSLDPFFKVFNVSSV